MDENISSRYLAETEKKLRYSPLYFKMRLARFINKWRQLLRFLMRYRRYSSFASPEVTQNLEKAAAHFQKHRWAYVENIISDEFHKELLNNFPKRYYFDAPTKLAKSYDTSFNWMHGQQFDFGRYDPHRQHPSIINFLDYLRSDKFQKRITEFVGSNQDFVCYSYTVNRTHVGSQVVPHKDGIQGDSRAKGFINIVFFINGTGGKNSGNLSLSRDNELKDLIIEPKNLKNSCLIYDSLANFYHGFSPVEKGKFRWAINSQFCEKSYVEK